MKNSSRSKETGVTLIELIIVISLLSVILTLGSINLFRPYQTATLDAAAENIKSLVREAQSKAINTDTQGDPASDDYGVHFEIGRAILFKGAIYSNGDPANFEISLPSNMTANPNLPCPSPPGNCNNIVLQRISGEVVNFSSSQNSVCITENSSGKNISLSVNFVGVVNTQNGC